MYTHAHMHTQTDRLQAEADRCCCNHCLMRPVTLQSILFYFIQKPCQIKTDEAKRYNIHPLHRNIQYVFGFKVVNCIGFLAHTVRGNMMNELSKPKIRYPISPGFKRRTFALHFNYIGTAAIWRSLLELLGNMHASVMQT